ncbi:hypothetical protein PCIT_a0819 [Pseudoalteromonas citrea]|uniref:Permease n=2 Tax=Pseudoalteromonas citrea TaxID=43655 RepID=A0AAD4FTA2_9GAMM|nr:SO_0444 family Cu/Zn efflux transporter [Pseudoalteromonas citrea]KAF7774383.1 hypothetical protein PCIT_a0819 [Pseudoalteromonas citrea]
MILINNFWSLFLLSAPWLMLGLLLAGILNVFIPANFLQRHLGKEGAWTTIKAALIGAPMPLCSCGVIPAAVGLRRAGASKSATTAFLVSTPETGVDSVSVSYVLLGPFMAVIRPIAAVTSAVVAGILVGSERPKAMSSERKEVFGDKISHDNGKVNVKTSTSCCSSAKPQPQQSTTCCDSVMVGKLPEPTEIKAIKRSAEASDESTMVSSCCDSQAAKPQQQVISTKVWQAIKFSSNKLLSDTMVWLMIGLFFAALVQTFVPTSFLSQWGNGIIAMLVVILVSIPMYICATASTPIAAGLLMAGVSPGAVLVFMLAGPATNIATLGVVGKELGTRAVFAYLFGVIGVAIAFGFLTDYLVTDYGFEVYSAMIMQHEILPHWFSASCAIVLSLLMLRLVLIKLGKSYYVSR